MPFGDVRPGGRRTLRSPSSRAAPPASSRSRPGSGPVGAGPQQSPRSRAAGPHSQRSRPCVHTRRACWSCRFGPATAATAQSCRWKSSWRSRRRSPVAGRYLRRRAGGPIGKRVKKTRTFAQVLMIVKEYYQSRHLVSGNLHDHGGPAPMDSGAAWYKGGRKERKRIWKRKRKRIVQK